MAGAGIVWCCSKDVEGSEVIYIVGMQAVVRVGASVLHNFEVNNGFRQGCTLAHTLFNLYLQWWRVDEGAVLRLE